MRVTLSRRNTHPLAATLFAAMALQFLTGSATRLERADDQSTRPPISGSAEPGRASRTVASRSRAGLAADAASVLFAMARRATDASKADALFAPKSWYVPPPAPPPAPPAPAAAPVAPPLPYTFVGSYNDGSSATVYFITREDRVYDVKPGDVIDQVYSVDAVENGQLVLTYKPLGVRQLLPIGAAP
jgi:hypothetical protein